MSDNDGAMIRCRYRNNLTWVIETVGLPALTSRRLVNHNGQPITTREQLAGAALEFRRAYGLEHLDIVVVEWAAQPRIDTANYWGVRAHEDTIEVGSPATEFTPDAALSFAAWLVMAAEQKSHFTPGEVLAAVRRAVL